MKKFRQILEEVNITISVYMLFSAILSGAIVFLIVYLGLSLFNINGYWSLIPSIIIFSIFTVRDLKKNKLQIVEESFDFLNEKLRTARDYLNKNNPFVEDLQDEIRNEIKKVDSAEFFDERIAYIKIGTIVVLCILILVLAPYQIVLFDFTKAVTDIIDRDDDNRTSRNPQIIRPEYQLVSVEDDWYGEFSLAELENEEMQVQLIETNYKLTSTEVIDPDKKDFDDIYPGEVAASRAQAHNAKVERENQEIVKNYFKEISK